MDIIVSRFFYLIPFIFLLFACGGGNTRSSDDNTNNNNVTDISAPTIDLSVTNCCDYTKGMTVTLLSDALDNVDVTHVEFLVRAPGSPYYVLFHSDENRPFEGEYPNGGFTDIHNGTYEFLSYAYDAAGNMGISNSQNLVIDVTSPQVTVVPKAIKLTTLGFVIIEVQSDEAGTVKLYDNGEMVDSTSETVVPIIFRREYNKSDNGVHIFTATVTDASGNEGTSPEVSFLVDIQWDWIVSPSDNLLDSIAIDGSGSVYAAGSTRNSTNAPPYDSYVIALSSSGNVLWEANYGDIENTQESHSIAVNHISGDIYLGGDTYVYGAIPESQCFIVKYDSFGSFLWSREVGDINSAEDGGFIAVDSNGNSYLAGSTWGSINGNLNQGRKDAFLVKFDGDGNLLWSRQLGSTAGPFNDDEVYAIAVAPAPAPATGIYIAGTTDGNIEPGYAGDGYKDAWIAKYNLDGDLQWIRQLGANGPDDYIQGVAVSPSGEVYVTGWNRGGLDSHPISGATEIFIAKYGADGAPHWVRQLGNSVGYVGSAWDYATAVTADSSGAYLTGMTSANLDGNMYQGFDDLILVKYTHDGDLEWTRTLGTPGYDQGWGITTDGVSGVFVAGVLDENYWMIAKHPLH